MTTLLAAANHAVELREIPRASLTAALRMAVDQLRDEIRSGESNGSGHEVSAVLEKARDVLRKQGAMRLRRVINATGIVLHTGLGRSVLAEAVQRRLTEAATGYCNLEIDLESGKRGQRGEYAEQLLCRLTGAQAAMVVNNNAAATMLVLHGLAKGSEVVVSRGQLIEIGGSYRLPEVMIAGGATLREIGTTNKTHLRDYQRAISDRTAMIMHVYTSNYRVVGFTQSPSLAELVKLAHSRELPLFDDLGSGALLDDELWNRADEPTAASSLRQGADVVAFSGDKLLGGPQAGILLGKAPVIEKLRRDPMARALRVDKLTIAALEATLELYESPERAKQEVPTLAALSESSDSLMRRAEALASALQHAMPDETFVVGLDRSFAGGGSLPAWPLPTATVRWKPRTAGSLDEMMKRLRTGERSLLARIHDGAIVLDVRTVISDEYDDVCAAMKSALNP